MNIQLHSSSSTCKHLARASRPASFKRYQLRTVASAVKGEKESLANTELKARPQVSQPTSEGAEWSDKDVDAVLENFWNQAKGRIGNTLDVDTARMLDSISYDDLMNKDIELHFRTLINARIGPFLETCGVTEDPFDFFIDILRVTTMVQLVTCGVIFYGSEFVGGFDGGEAFRAACGLVLGYMTRPFVQIDLIMYPIYRAILQAVRPEYSEAWTALAPSTSESWQTLLNQMAVMAAFAFIVPRVTLGWGNVECLQLLLPGLLAWFLFDIIYGLTVLAKLER